jgi:hypothetical protein
MGKRREDVDFFTTTITLHYTHCGGAPGLILFVVVTILGVGF